MSILCGQHCFAHHSFLMSAAVKASRDPDSPAWTYQFQSTLSTQCLKDAPHTSTIDCSFISLLHPPPLMCDTLESEGNSPGEGDRVDLHSHLSGEACS